MYRLRFDVETRNVATELVRMRFNSLLRFDVETRNVATKYKYNDTTYSCGLM